MRLKADILKKMQEGGYALCPFRVITTPATNISMNYAASERWTLEDYLEYLQCLEEVCALYDSHYHCCGLHPPDNT